MVILCIDDSGLPWLTGPGHFYVWQIVWDASVSVSQPYGLNIEVTSGVTSGAAPHEKPVF